MTKTHLTTVVRHLHRVGTLRKTAERSDSDLLREYSSLRDHSAFTTIVERHGPMVLGVCKRLLHHHQDAEDAFQATFLVLAQNADTVRKGKSLASWLHGVSYRIAMKARRKDTRRKNREQRTSTAASANPAWEAAWREVQSILDEEIERLPSIYSTVFVECCLNGLTKVEAAQKLSLKEGTVSSRLNKARTLLRGNLSKRGVALGGALGAVSLSGGPSQAVAKTLVAATVDAATSAKTGTAAVGTVTPQVLNLAKGETMLLGKLKLLTILLVTVAMFSAGLVLRSPHEASANSPRNGLQSDQQRSETDSKKGEQDKAKPSRAVSGTVLRSDGKPARGANLYVVSGANKKKDDVRAVADERGRFQLKITEAEARAGTLVAEAKGQIPDWLQLSEAADGKKVTLHLADDLPIEGKILDLQGRPVAGAKLLLGEIRAPLGTPDLDEWIKGAIVTFGGGGTPPRNALPPMKTALPHLLGIKSTKRTTDEHGRFQVRGVGRERILRMRIAGSGLETRWMTILTRHARDKALHTSIHNASFTALIGPGKEIFGTVRDKKTNQPIAGVRVTSGGSREITDKNGRYRLTGVGKKNEHYVSAYRGGCFSKSKRVADTPGVQPIEVDFVLERGIQVTGRLLDKATGKPVRARIFYVVANDNPNLKDYDTFGNAMGFIPAVATSKSDGSYEILAIPGAGILCITAEDTDRYVAAAMENWDGGLVNGVPSGFHPSQFHVVAPIHVDETKPETCKRDVVLVPGTVRKAALVGPDDKPVNGAFAAGLHPVPDRRPFGPLTSAECTIYGLSSRRPRNLVLFHKGKKLGAVVPVSSDKSMPLTIKLQPLGAVRGRALDGNGRPLAGRTVTVDLTRYIAAYKDLPWELLRVLGPKMKVTTKTDKNGKFQVGGLLPGLKYNLVVAEGEPKPGVTIHVWKENVAVETGKTKDVGDLKSMVPISN